MSRETRTAKVVRLQTLVLSVIVALIVGAVAGAFMLEPLLRPDRCERAWSYNDSGEIEAYNNGTIRGTAEYIVRDIFEVDPTFVKNLSGRIVAAEEDGGESLGVFDALEVCLSSDLQTATSVRVLD